MKIINQFKAGRQIQKLRSARTMSPEALAEVRDQLVAMGSDAIKPVMECLSHGEARGPAMEILGTLLDDRTLTLYLEALASPNPAVVTGVTKVLARSRNFDLLKVVQLLSDKSLPKANLESILWEQADHIPARALIGLIPELSKDARAVIIRLLEKIADESIVPDLIALKGDEDWWLRLYVAKLLGDFDKPEAVETLSELLADDHKGVRLEAVASLHRLGARDAVPALAECLRDPDLKVQSATIDALIQVCDASSVPHLLDILKDESEHSRRGAVEVLNEVATADAIQDLVRALRDEDWWVRVRAADALGTLGGPKVVDGVVGLLGDPDDFIRRYAVEILNAVPSERAVDHLIKALRDDDWWVRERSIDALAKTGDPRAVEPIMDLMHQDVSAIPHCVRALGLLGDTRAIPRLTGLADSENEEIRKEAVDALVRFSRGELSPGDRRAVSEALARAPIDSGRKSPLPEKGREVEVFGPEAGRTTTIGNPGSRTSPPSGDAPGDQPPSPVSPSSDAGAPAAAQQVNFYKLPRDTVLLDRFRVIRQIGKGGFGSIYLVEDAAVQDEIILKILNPQLSMDDTAIRRFVQELKLSRGITHENVIRLYDFLDLGGARAVSMEYFPSRDLGRVIYKEGKVSVPRTVEIVRQVCRGLQAAHEKGVIHRDIKPANILVGDDDRVKIVDFGLASMEQQVGSRLTKSGLLIGTPEYMAPEQITGTEVGHHADIYSLGLVMYEMLSGKKPFVAETPVKVLFLHLEGEAEPLSGLVSDLPPWLDELIGAAISKDPADRPENCNVILARIDEHAPYRDEAA